MCVILLHDGCCGESEGWACQPINSTITTSLVIYHFLYTNEVLSTSIVMIMFIFFGYMYLTSTQVYYRISDSKFTDVCFVPACPKPTCPGKVVRGYRQAPATRPSADRVRSEEDVLCQGLCQGVPEIHISNAGSHGAQNC